MRTNHIPARERVFARVRKLETRYEDSRESTPGNPYMRCKECGIRDPELSIRDGKHRGNCPSAGLLNEIRYYRNLLEVL